DVLKRTTNPANNTGNNVSGGVDDLGSTGQDGIDSAGKEVPDFFYWLAYNIADAGNKTGCSRLFVVDKCDGDIGRIDVLLSNGYDELTGGEGKRADGKSVRHDDVGSNAIDWLWECGNRDDCVWNEPKALVFSWNEAEGSTLLGNNSESGSLLGDD